MQKAAYEMTFSDKYDKVVINDDLEQAKADIYQIVKEFVEK